ncbi:MAG: hypothetical protein JW731_02005 [Bacteroidales bacterium]|nr:hypothetical protein [Bacteroidales bacterium]
MENYTFIYHPFHHLHQFIPSILPGIEKIVTVYYDTSDRLIRGSLTEKTNKIYSTKQLNIDKLLPTLQKYMEVKNPFDWYSKQSLPFEIESKSLNPSLDIFSELHNIVLLVRIPDESGEFNDLVFLYLNENPSNFGVTNSINPLTTDNKSIIAFFLYNTIKTYVWESRKNKQVLKKNNQRTRDLIDRAELMKQEMHITNENYSLSLVKLCQQFVSDWSERTGINYKLSAGALEKIKNYKGDIRDFENIINDTVTYINSLYLEDQKEIEILEWHLQLIPAGGYKSVRKEVVDSSSDRYGKTKQLLDKLENAALVLKTRNLKLTGTNVGNTIPVPISAPAISDALYNHKSKINSLLKQYPDKWITIRSEFRPLRNIMMSLDEESH